MIPMKSIVFAVTNDLSYDQRMHRICSTLQESGYDVMLIGRKRVRSVQLPKRDFTQRRLHCFFERGPLFYAEYNLRLGLVLLSHQATIFGACDLDTALAVIMAAKIKRRKAVFDAHEHFPEVPEVERRTFVKAVWHHMGKWCIPKFNVRYTVGESLAEVLQKEYHAPFSVVRNVPVLKAREILPLSRREKLIVYQGALNEGRGLEQAIDAMEMLPDFKLRLIGEGDLSKQLRKRVADKGLDKHIEFAGYIRPEEIYAYTHTALIGLNLLEARSRSYYYSLANKFFDYCHTGVPSINMDFPEYRNIIEKYPVGVCIENLSVEAIVNAVRRILNHASVSDQMLAACAEARMEYNWNKEKEVLLGLLRGPAQGP
jgi:glycosyltransferase involved in cell wall biosynthesis